MAKKEKINKALLASIVVDTNSAQGYALVAPSEVKALVDGGYIEVNPNIKSADGKIAARATASLLASSETAVAEVVAEKASFELTDGIPPTVSKRGGKKTEEYPFSKMEIGQSFVVPSTEAYPKPWETFASTVSSATRRFSNPDGTSKLNRKGESVPNLVPTRRFTLRQIVAGQTYEGLTFVESVNGARVFRTA